MENSSSEPTAIAITPTPPYYAVIFTSLRTDGERGYNAMSEQMFDLALKQPGFLGVESARDAGVGITVSYWTSEEAIFQWKRQVEHREAQQRGRTTWYRRYQVRVCKVERDYGYAAGHSPVEIEG